jgi:hypothetical protein
MPVIAEQFTLPAAQHAFDTAGRLADPLQCESMKKVLQRLIDEASWRA